MEKVLEVINSGDVASLIVLTVILCWIGSLMVKGQPQLGQWGWRLAAAAFIGYCVYTGSELENHTPRAWLQIVWRAILAAGLTAGVSWVVLAVYGFFKSVSDRASDAAKARAIERRHRKEQRRLEKIERRRRKEWKRQAPERDRQQRIADEQRRQAEAARVEAQHTRQDIRYACELFYSVHAPEIGDRFSRRDLDDFIQRYMGEDQPVDVVRRRTNQLIETIRRHIEAVDPPEEIATMEDLTVWYSQQKTKLEDLDIDVTFKEDYLIQLNERFAELSQRLLEAIKP